MKTAQQLQLIDGTFTPDEARQVVGSMVKSKIDFHTLAIHSEDERSGAADEQSGRRLRVLREIEAQLKDLCESARASGGKLRVKGLLEISAEE